MNINHNIVYWFQTEELGNEFVDECRKQKIEYKMLEGQCIGYELSKCKNIVPFIYNEYSIYNYEKDIREEKWEIYKYLGNGVSIKYEGNEIQNILTYIDNKFNLLNTEIDKLKTLLRNKE